MRRIPPQPSPAAAWKSKPKTTQSQTQTEQQNQNNQPPKIRPTKPTMTSNIGLNNFVDL